MALTLGGLVLGAAPKLTFDDAKRLAELDPLSAIGSSIEDLGELSKTFTLEGILTGSSRFNDFNQLSRYKRLGNSLKLDHELIRTVVFITKVSMTEALSWYLRYSLSLKESLFKQIHACNILTGITTTLSGGTLALAAGTPTPVEGANCVKLSKNAAENDSFDFTFTSADHYDLSNYDWFSFWIYVSSITNISSATITVTEGAHTATYSFSGLITAADTWLRIRVAKSDFTNYATVEWDEIDTIKIEITKNAASNYYVALDDVGGFE